MVTNLKYQIIIPFSELQVTGEKNHRVNAPVFSIGEAKILIGSTPSGGGFSEPSKMPCFSYNLPASFCKMGSIYRDIKGSVCSGCYACPSSNTSKKPAGGWYDSPRVQKAMMRRLKAVLFEPRWTDAMIFLLSHYRFQFFRWHDSGDIQSLDHLKNICHIAHSVPYTNFWLPTQQGDMLYKYWMENGKIPLDKLHPNLTIRLSAVMIDGLPALDFARKIGVKVSMVSKDSEKVDCPAYKQGNSCGPCRKCWNQKKESVVYHFHDGHDDVMHSEFIMNIKKLIDGLLYEGVKKRDIDKIISNRFHITRLNVRLIRASMLKDYKRKINILKKIS